MAWNRHAIVWRPKFDFHTDVNATSSKVTSPRHGASVKDVFHERAWLQSAVDRVQIKFIIECTGS